MLPSPSRSLHRHPSKAWAKPSTLAPAPPQPRQTLDLPFPIWWQLRARHTGNAARLGLPGKGIGMQRRGPTQPREDRMQASACAVHPHSLPVSSGSPV